MKIKAGGVWRNVSFKKKIGGLGWVMPRESFIKQAGLWRPFKHTDVLFITDIHDLVANGDEWTEHPQRGWYRNVYPSVEDQYTPMESTLSPDTLAMIRKVSATFTSYYDEPVGSLSLNYLRVHLNDGSIHIVGTNDAWADGPTGQNIYKADGGWEGKVTRNVINERYTLTVPTGKHVVGIEFLSYPAFTQGRYYPLSLCGMKDFEFILG